MTFKNDKAKVWTKPELTKLGTIKDVAGSTGTGTQAAGGGQFRS